MEHSHIAFDSRWIGQHGIGRFATELQDRLNFTCLFDDPNPPASFSSSVRLGRWLAGSGAKALYSPGYIPPSGSRLPFVFTIHDLNHIDVEHNSSTLKRLYYQLIIRPAIHRAEQVLTVSEFSRGRIVEWAGCDPERVTVVGNGVSDIFHAEVSPMQPGYAYFFCCSNRKGHKNEKRLIEAFKLSGLHRDCKLVFTGKANNALQQLISREGLQQQVLFTGHLCETELASWYRGAIATVFPSLYEGFGLPVAESMACGTPVITSELTSMPEVGGNAALYIDPHDSDSISLAMIAVAENAELSSRLCNRGLTQSRNFTWDRTASLVRDVLTQLQAQ
ncbi:glycosyltransferase family 4 protein [Halopseudomonas bauzanensis]|uniref:Glycosyltransferase family 4 protein n=1 Tax=Halopseudomonas bauzanensis TaxID=653930 RepID=A0A4U0YKE2_9GAMM|nr:glycosyltransferase family 1 protein [Halopseudomonas bauzanensis]TKA90184.1 glycosyltransferase family 4 protein [Halopseudomonas bauzanensis]